METKEEMSSGVEKEQELTQEALDAANIEGKETPAEAEPTVPLHVHTALRTRAQDAEVGQARAEGKLEALQTQTAKTATISPLDAEIARQKAEGIDEDDMSIPPSVIKADKLYEQSQVAKAAEAETTRQLGTLQVNSVNTARLVHDDFMEVVKAGQGFLSDGEALDVGRAGKDYGELVYAKCQVAIERNKPVKKDDAAPEKEPSKSEAEAKEKTEAEAKKKEELASQEELLHKHKIANPTVGKAFDL